MILANDAQLMMNAHTQTYPNHLLSAASLLQSDVERLFDLAGAYLERNRQGDKKHPILRGRTQINLFFENSTRTRTSFELAGKRLGMDVINISSSASAVKKGESLIDTAMTLNAMQPDVLVIRHPQSGAVQLMQDFVDCKVINAGDGRNQHPTQALLDALVIQQKTGAIKGRVVAICGDLAHSRVARSNIALLQMLGATVRLIAPPQLMPAQAECLGCELYYHMRDGLRDADVVMMLRTQTERMVGPLIASIREYFHLYGLTYDKLALAKPDALVMHPGPINRGVEIATDLADDLERNGILNQVEAGVAIRQALLVDMLGENR